VPPARTPQPPGDALGPVRAALERAARDEADAVVRAAREQAAAVLSRADALAAQVRDRATREGEELAADDARRQRSRARRQAREVVLSARAEVSVAELLAVRTAATRLTADPDYSTAVAALTERARGTLADGPGCPVDVQLCADGGIRARQGSRTLDLRLSTLAELYLRVDR
jgi:vacuolar-type H+-ATPase subunit H